MKKISTLFLCTLFTLASCIPQKASANILLDVASATSTFAGLGLGTATTVLGIIACAFSNDSPNEETVKKLRKEISSYMLKGYAVSAGLIIIGCMGNAQISAEIVQQMLYQK